MFKMSIIKKRVYTLICLFLLLLLLQNLYTSLITNKDVVVPPPYVWNQAPPRELPEFDPESRDVLWKSITVDCRRDPTANLIKPYNESDDTLWRKDRGASDVSLWPKSALYGFDGNFSWCAEFMAKDDAMSEKANNATIYYHYVGPEKLQEAALSEVQAAKDKTNSNSNNDSNIRKPSGLLPYKYRTQKGIQKCLGGKHLVFIGDSRARFQFIALAWALVGQWKHDPMPAVCERMFGVPGPEQADDPGCWLIGGHFNFSGTSWNMFLQRIALFMSNVTNVRYLCQCARDSSWAGLKKEKPRAENHFFEFDTPNYGRIKMTYMQTFGPGDLRESDDFPPYAPIGNVTSPFRAAASLPPLDNTSQEARCSMNVDHNTCGDKYRKYTMEQALSNMVVNLKPTHVFASVGWGYSTKYQDISCALLNGKQASRQTGDPNYPGYEPFFVHHPHPHRHPKPWTPSWLGNPAKWKCQQEGLKQTFFPHYAGTPGSFRWDHIHAYTHLNHAHNNVFLDEICPLPE